VIPASIQALRRARGLHGVLVEILGQQIVDGTVDPGKPLVPEAVGEKYEVSRTVVRETLRVLETKGLIAARPNTGTRVRPIEEWNLLDADVLRWRASSEANGDDVLGEQVRVFTGMMLALRPALEDNLLYRQLLAVLGVTPEPAADGAIEDAATAAADAGAEAAEELDGEGIEELGAGAGAAFVATVLEAASPTPALSQHAEAAA